MIDPKETQHGRSLHAAGLPDTHLSRFHTDDRASQLSAYGVFHGDDRQPEGHPLPTGSLRRSGSPATQRLGDTGGRTYHTMVGGAPPKYIIQPTMSLHMLSRTYGYTGDVKGGSLGATSRALGSSSYAPKAGGAAFSFTNGNTFRATSGLPPTQYKAWSTESRDEFRSMQDRRAIGEAQTIRHGTASALSTSRYQFQGYPNHTTNPAFKTLSPSSLTNRNNATPSYEHRFAAF